MSEHLYFVIAGVPHTIYDHVYKQPPYKLGAGDCKGTVVSAPLRQDAAGVYSYTPQYAQALVKRLFIDAMPKLKANSGLEVHVFLVFIDYGRSNGDLLGEFFPFSLNLALKDLGFLSAQPKVVAQRKNALVQHIKEAVTLLRQRVGAIKHNLNSHRSKTAFLLPIQNFRSSHLSDLIRRAAIELPKSHQTEKAIRAMQRDFTARHPLTTLGSNRFFEDARGLIFKAPPDRLLHGQNVRENSIHGGGGHIDRCRITGRTRLGAPYKASFHYDCEYAEQRVTGDFSNCHGDVVQARRWTHVNIAPNDWVG